MSRKRELGFSDEVHERLLELYARRAAFHGRLAEQELSKGRCKGALRWLTSSQRLLGAASAHASSRGGERRRLESVREIIDQVESDLRKRCIR
jgi:hypothetical protein